MSQVSNSWRAHFRATLALGLPLVGGQLAQFGIHMTDTIMLGWYSIEALAAMVLASTMFFVLYIVGSGFGWAVMPMVASAYSADDAQAARRATRMALWLSALFAIAVIPIMMAARPILEAMGQDPSVSLQAERYLRIAGWGMLAQLPVVVFRSYLSALDRAGIVLWVTLATLVMNAFLNYALIFGNWGAPELGIRGAAIASLTVQLITAVVLLVISARARPDHHLLIRFWKPDWRGFGEVFRLGWPIGLTSLAEAGLFSAASVMMGWLGTLQLAAHGIALQVVATIFMIQIGLSQAATVRAGRALGRRDEAGLRRSGLVAIGLSASVAVFTVLLLIIFPGALVSLFIDPSDPARDAVLAIGLTLLAAGAVFQLADAAQVMALGLLRGVQDTRAPMIMAIVSYWVVGLPVSYVLGFPMGLGGVGIWLGLASGLALAAILMMTRFWNRSVRIASA